MMLRVQAERMHGGVLPLVAGVRGALRALRTPGGPAARARGGAAPGPDGARHGDRARGGRRARRARCWRRCATACTCGWPSSTTCWREPPHERNRHDTDLLITRRPPVRRGRPRRRPRPRRRRRRDRPGPGRPESGETLDADGLVLLPGLRRPAHAPARARRRGVRDRRHRLGRRRARRLHRGVRDAQHGPGGRLRRRRRARAPPRRGGRARRRAPGRRRHRRARGERMAELGTMAASRARVRMFSDDGRCVNDPLIMRRALEYASSLDAVIAQHAEDHRLTAGAQAHEGVGRGPARAGRLAGDGRGDDRRPRLRAGPRGRGAAARLPRLLGAHRSRCCARRRRRASGSPPRSPRTTCCSPTRALTGYDPVHKVNPPLRTGDDTAAMRAALAEGVIDVVATDHAPHAVAVQGHRVGAPRSRACSGCRRRCRWWCRPWSSRGCWTGAASPACCPSARPRSAGWPTRAARSRWGSRRRSPSSTRTASGRCAARRSPAGRVEHAVRGHAAAGDGGRDGAARPGHGARREGQDGPGYGMMRLRFWCSRTGGSSAASATAPSGQTLGEAVFCTAMTGYQETLTDPATTARSWWPTAPQIGNTGWNDEDDESARIQVAGYVVRDPSRVASNWRSRRSLDDALERPGDRRPRRHRHPRAGPAPARAGGDEGRAVLRRRPGPGRRAGGAGPVRPVDGGRRPLRRGHDSSGVRRARGR